MRALLVLLLAVGLCAGGIRPAAASPHPQANLYFQVRDRAQVVEGLRQDDLPYPQRFAGRLVEVRGTISALVSTDELCNLLISGGANEPAVHVELPEAERAAKWPFLNVGAGVRCLCRVAGEAGNGVVELVIPVKEEEALVVDQSRAQAQAREDAMRRAAEQRARRAPQQMASRGAGSAARRAPGRIPYPQLVEIYANAVHYFNRRLSPHEAREIARSIIDYSVQYDLDARLVMAVIAVESNFNQHAVSRVGARGLGQLMPGTANDLGVGDSFDVRQNLEGSTRLLKNHINNLTPDGRPTEEAIKLALACYNAGAGAVRKYRGIPPYRETQNYVVKVTRLYRQMCGLE